MRDRPWVFRRIWDSFLTGNKMAADMAADRFREVYQPRAIAAIPIQVTMVVKLDLRLSGL